MEKVETRFIIILVVVVGCILGIIGFPKNITEMEQNIADRIKLGLDLKGGTYLVLQVHVEDALNITADQAVERLRDGLQSKNIQYADIRKADSTHVLIKGVAQNSWGAVEALTNSQFSDWTLGAVAGDLTSRTLTLKPSAVATLKSETFTQAMDTVRRRIDALGLVEPEVAQYGQGEYEMVVQLPGLDDPARVRDVIQKTALLELKIVRDGPFPTQDAALGAHGGVLPPDTELLPGNPENGGTGGDVWYIVDQVAAVTGRDLTDAQPSTYTDGSPDVIFTFNRDGAARFSQVTAANIHKTLAVVIDQRVYEAATIEGQISDRGEIHGGSFTPQSAADLALVLRSGALPASLSYLQSETVGPSLGKDSIYHGELASLAAFIAILTFMLVYYRGAGINADVALILNLLILVAALSYFGAVLTLPGIAGVILTVGMGVDSNVLIFERIREELRAGKAVGAAVAGGFEHAFKTIIDTHVTTVASAAILFTFGTGPIRGFAVTLVIGLVANLFTSVFVSRVIFDYGLSKRVRGAELSIGM